MLRKVDTEAKLTKGEKNLCPIGPLIRESGVLRYGELTTWKKLKQMVIDGEAEIFPVGNHLMVKDIRDN